MNFVFKTRSCVSKTRSCVLKNEELCIQNDEINLQRPWRRHRQSSSGKAVVAITMVLQALICALVLMTSPRADAQRSH